MKLLSLGDVGGLCRKSSMANITLHSYENFPESYWTVLRKVNIFRARWAVQLSSDCSDVVLSQSHRILENTLSY